MLIQRLSILVLLFAITFMSPGFAKKLETIPDKELMQLIKTEKYVVALFSKENCKECRDLEHELAMTREVLVDSLNAWVVKLINSPLKKNYSPNPEPAVIFFRNGLPLLYHGQPTEEDLLTKIQRGQETAVKNLDDSNFEHLTQAATGATTGDWLVMFTRDSCEECKRLEGTWEAVGLELKDRINVARVDKGGNGGVTARRFDVLETPAFLLFRHGKLYKYELDSFTLQNFVDFATDFYRNSKAIGVPAPKSPFDDLTEMIVEKMRENPQLVKLGSIVFTIVFLLGILIKVRGGGKKPVKKVKVVKKKVPKEVD